MVSYAVQNDASPSLRAASGQIAATCVGSWEAQRVASYADQKEASPSLGAASCEAVAGFGCSWEAQRTGAIRKSE